MNQEINTQTAEQSYLTRNVDFSIPVMIAADALAYEDTPMIGVKRKMFERQGDEIVQRATSCVRYAPGSAFKPHQHPGGEEFLVLEGVFSDQNGDYPQGYYVRNPVGSSHAPFTTSGCEIFVKLSQMPVQEQEAFRLNTTEATWQQVTPLHQQLGLWHSDQEFTTLHRFDAGYTHSETFTALVEIFVCRGEITVNDQSFEQGAWIRLPAGTAVSIQALANTTIYRKIGTGETRI